MIEPYYQDELVTLYHGRCEDILPAIETQGSVHLLTDPPYFKVKDAAWDNQWNKASEFLDWMGQWMDLVKPLLSANASVWVFASPELTSAVESVVAGRFRVLNSVRWLKQGSMAHRASLPELRSFLSAWEGIVFAEQFDDVYGDTSLALHKKVFAPLGRYLQSEWERAGWKAGRVGLALGYDSALPTRWAEGNSLPTEDAYGRLRALLNRDGGTYLRREYDDLWREYELLRRPFSVSDRKLSKDVWDMPSMPARPGRHPCEKPSGLLTHMIQTSTRRGDTVIDCFAGSGAVLDTARQLGRHAIGVEMDERWCERIAQRLTQQTFDFGEIA